MDCPQPRKETICYTCGNAGHTGPRCPYAICLKVICDWRPWGSTELIAIHFQCGDKTDSYRRGCDRCLRTTNVLCVKCRRRGHYARDCPDNWRAYHNTVSIFERNFRKIYWKLGGRVSCFQSNRPITRSLDVCSTVYQLGCTKKNYFKRPEVCSSVEFFPDYFSNINLFFNVRSRQNLLIKIDFSVTLIFFLLNMINLVNVYDIYSWDQ